MARMETRRKHNNAKTLPKMKSLKHCNTEAQRGRAATKDKELTWKFSHEETERREKKPGEGKNFYRRDPKPQPNKDYRMERSNGTREAYGVRCIPALFICVPPDTHCYHPLVANANPKRRNTAHSIRFALLEAILILQA